jgi:hypothetical protein
MHRERMLQNRSEVQVRTASKQKLHQERLMKQVRHELMTTEQQEMENITRNDPMLTHINQLFQDSHTSFNKDSLTELIEQVEKTETSPDQTRKFIRTK